MRGSGWRKAWEVKEDGNGGVVCVSEMIRRRVVTVLGADAVAITWAPIRISARTMINYVGESYVDTFRSAVHLGDWGCHK